MSKREVVEEIVAGDEFDNAAQAGRAVDAVFDAVKAVVDRGGTVQIRGFGSFRLERGKARVGRNPRTGEPLQIPARDKMKFREPRRSDG